MKLPIPDELAALLTRTPSLKQAYPAGGCVRDCLLGRTPKDFDIEVFGVRYEELVAGLETGGRTDLVGRSFGVVKLTTQTGATYDFTLPRRDSKVAPGHKGFDITFDPSITPRDAAARRDFTINSMLFDPRKDEVLDFHGGQDDLRHGILRHTSEAFVEDPLRVLRGMQFAGRFDLRLAPETAELCRRIQGHYSELAVERVREEWFKWAEKSTVPSAGLRALEESGWLGHFPEVHALRGTRQDPEWHPEGDVFDHTGHCLDALVNLPGWRQADSESRIVYSLAVLAHDFAKPAMTREELREGRMRIVSPGHEAAGGPVAEAFLERINAPAAIRERVVPLVANHMAHLQTHTARSVRRLARRLVPETIQGLCLVMTADHFGRPPRPRVVPAGITELLAKAEELKLRDSAPKPVLLGRHLLELGMTPGREFGVLLEAAFEAQIEGAFEDLPGAFAWLASQDEIALPEDTRRAAIEKAGVN